MERSIRTHRALALRRPALDGALFQPFARNRRVMLLQLILFNLYLDPVGVLEELYRFGSHRSRICRSRDKLVVFDQRKKQRDMNMRVGNIFRYERLNNCRQTGSS